MGSERKLVYYGHPALRIHAEPIDEITDEIKEIAADLLRVFKSLNAAGLAAHQIGEPIRMFICAVDSRESDGVGFMVPPKIFINPKIEILGDETHTDLEGCLSIPNLYEPVSRPYRIRTTALDIDGNEFTEESFGYRARNILHENDHLNGVLHIDRLSPIRKKQIAPQLKKIKKKFNK
ncbi:MAG: peptide deformylase [Simkaniaceae bacterium]|nr:peptide deformylase [Simkaniaceae bacterium]